MRVKLEDLKPLGQEIKIGDKTYKLKPFTLDVHLWASTEFMADGKNGLFILAEKLAGITQNLDAALSAACKVAYHLLKDNPFNSYDAFIKEIQRQEHPYTTMVNIHQSVCKNINDSKPKVEDVEEDLELKKRLAAILAPRNLVMLGSLTLLLAAIIILSINFIA